MNIPKHDVNGMILDSDNIYYRVYVDGEQYIFDPVFYPEFTDPTTDIPYDLDDDCYFDVATQLHSLIVDCSGWDSIGVQTVYKSNDGELVSDITYYFLNSIDSINQTKVEVSREYYDLTGRKVLSPENGYYIEVVRYDDFSVESRKIYFNHR